MGIGIAVVALYFRAGKNNERGIFVQGLVVNRCRYTFFLRQIVEKGDIERGCSCIRKTAWKNKNMQEYTTRAADSQVGRMLYLVGGENDDLDDGEDELRTQRLSGFIDSWLRCPTIDLLEKNNPSLPMDTTVYCMYRTGASQERVSIRVSSCMFSLIEYSQ